MYTPFIQGVLRPGPEIAIEFVDYPRNRAFYPGGEESNRLPPFRDLSPAPALPVSIVYAPYYVDSTTVLRNATRRFLVKGKANAPITGVL